LAAAARPVWLSAGGGQRWLQIARDLSDDRTPPSLVARLDNAAAWSGFVAGEFQAALATGCRLMTVYREFGDPLGVAYAQSLAVLALLPLGRLGEAEPFLTAALEIARAHQRAPLIALLLRAESLLSSLRGELDQSREKLVEALAIYERIGTDRHAAFIIGSLAELEFRVGNVQRAFELATKGVNLLRAQGSRQMVQGLINIAAYSIALNRWDRASANAGEALSLAREAQDIMGTTVALEHLAAVAVLAPSNDSTSDRSEPGPAPAFATAILTPLDPSCSRLTRAALLLGYVDACAVNLGVPREYTEQQEFDRVLASLRVTVHADELAQIMAHGAMLTLEGAIELALSLNV
jgi:tetratricopeptide (TPR) repeat protein